MFDKAKQRICMWGNDKSIQTNTCKQQPILIESEFNFDLNNHFRSSIIEKVSDVSKHFQFRIDCAYDKWILDFQMNISINFGWLMMRNYRPEWVVHALLSYGVRISWISNGSFNWSEMRMNSCSKHQRQGRLRSVSIRSPIKYLLGIGERMHFGIY